MRTPVDALRSMARYTALALGPEFEVRLSSEKGVFARPFARVAQVPSFQFIPVRAALGAGQGGAAKIMSSYQILCYPSAGTQADGSQLEALRLVDLIWRAFAGTGVQGAGAPALRQGPRPYPHRVPLYDYAGIPLQGPDAFATEANRDPRDFLHLEAPPDVTTMSEPGDELLYTVAANIRMSWVRFAAVPSSAPMIVRVGVGADTNG